MLGGLGQLDSHLLQINPMFGAHLDFPQMLSFHPFATQKDVENYFERLRRFSTYIDQCIEVLTTGVSRSIVTPIPLLEKCFPQIEVHLVDDVNKSEFFRPLEQLKNFSDTDKTSMQDEARKLVGDRILPGYQKLLDYLKNTDRSRYKELIGRLGLRR